MKRISLLVLMAALCTATSHAAHNVTNTVVTVDQHGNLNVEGVASVEDVATNAVKATIAEAKADAAQSTARGVTNAINTVVENIMANNVVIYRSGFSDSFAPLVNFGPETVLHMVEARWIEMSSSRIVVEIDYVSNADLGALKPIVFHRETLDGVASRDDFAELADANVTAPVYHAEPRVYKDQTFAGYYTIRATIPNPASTTSYFLWIKADGDAPSGDGVTLDIPNGVTGGYTGVVQWGDRTLNFRGGVLVGVSDD